MTTQINLRLPENLRKMAQKRVKERGYRNIQELAMEALREKVVEYDDEFTQREIAILERTARIALQEPRYPKEELLKHMRAKDVPRRDRKTIPR